VGIDAPDFNLGLERRLRDHGVPTVHFIGPSIWAWRPERIEAIRRSVNHMLLVFPFEKPIYDAAGISATYVGHPLADVLNPSTDTAAARLALELPLNRPVVALLPGSRPDEVRYMGRTVLQTAAWIHRQRPDCHFVLPAASPALLETLRRQAAALRLDSSLPLTLVSGQSHRAMLAADTVLVASGTATLEAALLGRPMVIFYRMAALSFLLMRNRGLLPWIGLPNILCRESLVPEFIQHEASPEALGAALLAQLDDNSLRGRLHQRFTDMHGTLARGCAKRSAEAILGVCESVKEAA
jgi:lipid-A-disaccharide synthase